MEVCNRFTSLEETDDIEIRWSNFKDAVHTAADSVICQQQGTRKKQWISNESWTPIDERKKSQIERDQAVSEDITVTLGRNYNDLNKAVKNSCKLHQKSGLKANAKKQNMLLQKTMLGFFTKLSET